MMKRLVLSAFCAALGLALPAERIELAKNGARCVIETHGARVISYRTADGADVFWNADPVQTESDTWAHGGMPVCWPYFGKDAEGRFHGFAWKRDFRVAERSADRVRLELPTPEATLVYTLALDADALSLVFETRNTGTKPFTFVGGVHPYFKVGERARTVISGVREKPFAFTEKLDDVYPCAAEPSRVFRIDDPVSARAVEIRAQGADSVVVWNPGPEKKCPGLIPGDEWRRFACVEPRAGKPVKRILAPGESHVLTCAIRPLAK